MPFPLTALLRLALLPLGFWMIQDPGRAPATLAWPTTAGVYAMTTQGPVELRISGERNAVDKALGLEVVYSPDDFDRIPVADTVQSFFMNVVGWEPKDLYLVVGRQRLTDPLTKYQHLSARAITRGVAAFQVISDDLAPAFLLKAIRRLAPKGITNVEPYIVLELKSTAGLNNRSYPVRITVPKQ